MHCVYALRSLAEPDETYVGATSNLKQRIADHNAGRSVHTSKHMPWQLEFYAAFPDKQRAYEFEVYLKSHSGRAFANKRLIRRIK